MQRKKPSSTRGKKQVSFLPTTEAEYKAFKKAMKLEREKREKEGYSIELSYPLNYEKWSDEGAIRVQSADGYDHYFYPTKSGWDYDGGGMEFNERGKLKRAKAISGSVKVFLPVKSIKIGARGNGLTIVDAKNKTYKFA